MDVGLMGGCGGTHSHLTAEPFLGVKFSCVCMGSFQVLQHTPPYLHVWLIGKFIIIIIYHMLLFIYLE